MEQWLSEKLVKCRISDIKCGFHESLDRVRAAYRRTHKLTEEQVELALVLLLHEEG